MKSLKKTREKLRENGVFYTPAPLAEYVRGIATAIMPNYQTVYDPCCGNGNLLAVFPENAQKYGQEIDFSELEEAKQRLKNFTGASGDTLQNPAFFGQKFDIVVANPPFSTKWQPPAPLFADERFLGIPAMPPASKSDFAFLLHILHYLSENGVAVAVCGTGILYRGHSEGKLRQFFIENGYIGEVIYVDNPEFEDTSIPVVILVLQKNRLKDTPVRFLDKTTGKEAFATIGDIAKNDYSLSKRMYIWHDLPKEPEMDIAETQKQARMAMIKSIQKDIEVDKMVCELFGTDHQEYINMLFELISKYK